MSFTDLLRAEVTSVLAGEARGPAAAGESAQDIAHARSLALDLVAGWKAANKKGGRAAMRTGFIALGAASAAGVTLAYFFSAFAPLVAVAASAALALIAAAAAFVIYRSAARLAHTHPSAGEILAAFESGESTRSRRAS